MTYYLSIAFLNKVRDREYRTNFIWTISPHRAFETSAVMISIDTFISLYLVSFFHADLTTEQPGKWGFLERITVNKSVKNGYLAYFGISPYRYKDEGF